MRAHIAAFFDLDGTLLPPPSLERRFLRFLRACGELRAANGACWLARFARDVWRDPVAATEGNKAHLAGFPAATLDAWLAWLRRFPPPLFPAALARMEWHAAQGHRVFLVTGTLRPIAEAIARRLPAVADICATELESLAGRWTGGFAAEGFGAAVCGPAKARAVEHLARAQGLALERSYAYGDRWADGWMLARVGNPVAVNPSPALARVARRRGWPVVRWLSEAQHGGTVVEFSSASEVSCAGQKV